MSDTAPVDRRHFVAYLSALGLSGTLFPGVLWARVRQEPAITKQMIAEAEKVAGLEFTDAEREQMARGLNQNAQAYAQVRKVAVENAVPPAIQFDPVLPGTEVPSEWRKMRPSKPGRVRRPANLEEAVFWPVTQLAELVRTKQVSSTELTRLYLDRLKRYGEKPLEALITLTEERALRQAAQADEEIRRGRYRGPLHGIPWGAKDLLAVKGYRTTWGARPYEQQVIEEDATVVRKLDEAGAVLVAKLTLGALAQGDVWYGGVTKNPWKLDQGSSGSSAGSSATTVAGLVGFAVGSETLGSIVSPATRTGATGLRPSFGRVSRHGAMALAWSMDKLGPLCRSVEDCALVLHAIQGADGKDPTARDVPFNWDASVKPADLRVGYIRSAFEREILATAPEAEREGKAFDVAALEVLRSLGARLVPFELPADYPVAALRFILTAEAGAAFGEPLLSGKLATLDRSSWPNTFRQARFIPAVEYIQANRVRTLVMRALHEAMKDVDVVVAPSFANNLLLLTNLTGHPAVVLPHGFTQAGTPVSLTFIGKLWGEAEALALAKAYQDASGFHLKHPAAFV